MQSAIRGSIIQFTRAWLVALTMLAIVGISSANEPFSASTFDDWLVDCTPIEDPVDPEHRLECSMSQLIEFEDNNEPLLKIDLYLNPENSAPEAVFILPLGIPLNNDPILSFNHSKSRPLKISHCHSDGCYFKISLSNALLETFLSMQSGQIKLNGNDNESITIPISGKGSRSAYNYFKALPKN